MSGNRRSIDAAEEALRLGPDLLLRGPARDETKLSIELEHLGDRVSFFAGGVEVGDAELREAEGAEEGGEVLRRQAEAKGQDVGAAGGHQIIAVDEDGARGEGKAQPPQLLLGNRKDGRPLGGHPLPSQAKDGQSDQRQQRDPQTDLGVHGIPPAFSNEAERQYPTGSRLPLPETHRASTLPHPQDKDVKAHQCNSQ